MSYPHFTPITQESTAATENTVTGGHVNNVSLTHWPWVCRHTAFKTSKQTLLKLKGTYFDTVSLILFVSKYTL